jgi:hypothetical protein
MTQQAMDKRFRKKILFINPWIYDFAAGNFWSKPLGLLYLAALFRKYGFDVQYYDGMQYDPSRKKQFGLPQFYQHEVDKPKVFLEQANQKNRLIPRKFKQYGLGKGHFRKWLAAYGPFDIAFVTCSFTYWYQGAFEAIEAIKENNPQIKVLLGGAYAKLCERHAKKLSKADIIFSGTHFSDVIHTFNNIFDMSLPNLPDLDQLPFAAFDLDTSLSFVPIITTLGCPYQCDYCASKMLFPKYQRRDPNHVFEELFFWYKEFGVKDFAFYDDALLYKWQSHGELLFNKISEFDKPINFHLPNGIDSALITEPIAKMLKSAKAKTIRIAFDKKDSLSIYTYDNRRRNN